MNDLNGSNLPLRAIRCLIRPRGFAGLLGLFLTACQGVGQDVAKPLENSTTSSKTMPAPSSNPVNRTLIASRPQEGRIGTLTFNAANEGTLATEGSGPAVEELKKAWKEIAAMPKVTWVKSVVEESAGRKVTAIEAEEYSKSDANYFYAVLDTLSRRYGFSVDIGK